MINYHEKTFTERVKENPKLFTALLGLVAGGFVIGFMVGQLIDLVSFIVKTSNELIN